MTTRFRDKIIPWLFDHEGRSFENDSDDPGGCTKFGVDQRSHPDVDIKNLTEEQAEQIYWSEWIKYGCNHLPSPLDWIYFDASVNCGNYRASKLLDASGRDPKKYQQERIDFYNRLADQQPRLAKFRKGWISRVIDLSKVTGVV